jgi:lysine biosynthesis protein LysW
MMARAYCPACDAAIVMAEPEVGSRIRCGGCNTELEIVSDEPFDVFFPFDEWEEIQDTDWDDDDF